MGFLLDTSALSELMRLRPRPAFVERLGGAAARDLFTSSVCVMELRYGCALKGGAGLWRRLERDVLGLVEVLPFGSSEAVRCGEILALLSRKGTPIGIEDTQIGATALEHGLAVVTFNTRHFEKIPGLRVENWGADS